MAFIASVINTDKQEEPSKAPLSSSNLNLTKEDIELLLLTIREMNFKGEHIERVYTVVYKLQQYYMSFNQ